MERKSLKEFEKIEQEIKDVEFILSGEIISKSGVPDTGDKRTLLYSDESNKASTKPTMLFSEDPNVLKEFEDLEEAFEEIAKIKLKATEQEHILKQENQYNTSTQTNL